MRIFNRSISTASLALLVVQLMIVSMVAAKYAIDSWRCPRVWTRAVGYDPQLPLRGRYLALQLRVDGCGSTLPSAAEAKFPRDVNGSVKPGPFTIGRFPTLRFPANLIVEKDRLGKDRLEAVRISDAETRDEGQIVNAWAGASCDAMTLDQPVFYYVPDSAPALFPLKPGQELWIEATIPPVGPPRPTHLAIKESGEWKPLAF